MLLIIALKQEWFWEPTIKTIQSVIQRNHLSARLLPILKLNACILNRPVLAYLLRQTRVLFEIWPDFASWKESGIPSSVKHLGYRKNSNWNNFTYREIF